MNNYLNYLKRSSIALFGLILLASCSDVDEDYVNDHDGNETTLGVQVASNAEFGSILVDQNNHALYFFAGDVKGESNCTGGCANIWPAFTGDVDALEVGSGLNSNDFDTITREDGSKQITYKGWPLYNFSIDGDGFFAPPNEVTGDGQGDVFYVAKPDYSLMLGQQVIEEGEEPILYLVDDRGVTLYFTLGDGQNSSNCVGGCAGVWPPFKAPGELILPSFLDESGFSLVERGDDLGPQLARFGFPLYNFSPDEQIRGNVLGHEGGPNSNFFVFDAVQEQIEIGHQVKVLNNNAFGGILVDQNNQSLYFFAGDVKGERTCTGGCANVWPAFTADLGELIIGSNLSNDDFGKITLDDGEEQITFKGWPLYYFSPDGDGILEPEGEVTGDGSGDVFYVAKPDYSIMLGKQVIDEGQNSILYLVDDRGVTIYFTTGDEPNISKCVGGCAGVWPPLKVPEELILPSFLNLDNFSGVERDDDLGPQLSIFNLPLYFFSLDEKTRGNVLGHRGGPNANFFVMDPLD